MSKIVRYYVLLALLCPSFAVKAHAAADLQTFFQSIIKNYPESVEQEVTQDDVASLFSSADEGNAESLVSIGNLYFWGKGIPQNYLNAIANYKEAAQAGNGIAKITLGSLYYRGMGVSKSTTIAYHWFDDAAQNSNGIATLLAATMQLYGNGTDRDENKAFTRLEALIENDDSFAEDMRATIANQMGLIYFNRIGGDADYNRIQSGMWHFIAVKLGMSGAQENLNKIENRMYPNQIAQAHNFAEAWLKNYAKKKEEKKEAERSSVPPSFPSGFEFAPMAE